MDKWIQEDADVRYLPTRGEGPLKYHLPLVTSFPIASRPNPLDNSLEYSI